MSMYREDQLSEAEFNRLVDEAEENGWDWFVDLGDDDDIETSDVVNFLIIENGPICGCGYPLSEEDKICPDCGAPTTC